MYAGTNAAPKRLPEWGKNPGTFKSAVIGGVVASILKAINPTGASLCG